MGGPPEAIHKYGVIDSHCHLADRKFSRDLDAVLLRAEEHGIDAMVTIADTLEESKQCIRIAEEHPQIFCTVGVHPHHASDWNDASADQLRRLVTASAKVKAIGEIGLDYHYDRSPRDVQRRVFRDQLALAKELHLPVVIHCREAIADVRAIAQEVLPAKLVLHCCTEWWEDVQWVVDAGQLLSFTGIATYPQSGFIRRTIEHCPLSQLMVETDSPYLAPTLHRGKRNEPAFVRAVSQCVADVQGISLNEVDAQTTENAVEFFSLRL